MAKRGRPRKNKDLTPDETQGEGDTEVKFNYRGTMRQQMYTLSQKIRERIDPSIYIQTIAMVMQGRVPLWIPDDRVKGGYRVEPDPNPLLPSPNLEQRMAAMRELINRGEGLPVQSIQMDAHFRNQLDAGLPVEMLAQANMKMLADLHNIIKSYKEKDIVDAELVPPLQLQEPGQVVEGEKLGLGEVLQEACQDPVNVELGNNSPEPGTNSED